ncbi:LpqB family beta-propeller domain-containing protein [Pseudonocardia sp. N23]|uniref:LpqB family beta-propeller domain-containing protein n=1 Tax=Pseudonocardia sp. N23 TaxID=1987376 RepID=UPI000BFBB088|nr:LpqB family beta-propeller domain-containing protein [Pseudonocardia sp. N23]GAY09949.1 LpqB protein [Pseudonocardia sp. N23]
MNGPRARAVLVVLLAVLAVGVSACATVPGESSVQVLRKVSDGEAPPAPPGPVDGTNPLDLVRGFVYASGSSADRHGAARRFLAPEAGNWDDGASVTVLDEQFGTVPVATGSDTTTVRIRGTRIGTLTASGAFEPGEAPVEADVTAVRRDGQWRISAVPPGVFVRLSDLRSNYRSVKVYFVDPARSVVVPDLRYLPAVPAKAQAARVVDMLLDGPSPALAGAVATRLPETASLTSNVTETADGGLVVDLTGVGTLDDAGRRLLAAQVVLTLSEVNATRVRLLIDGAPVLAATPDITRAEVASASAGAADATAPQQPALVTTGGRVRKLGGDDPGGPVAGQAGNGAFDIATAAITPDGGRQAVVSREGTRSRLIVGEGDKPLQGTDVTGTVLTRPTWAPGGSEVWTVADGTVARVVTDAGAPPRRAPVDASAITAVGGAVTSFRMSRDGMRVAAVVGGRVVTASVARAADGSVTLRSARLLRPGELGDAVAVDWRSTDTVVVVSARSDRAVSLVSADGLALDSVSGSNLTPPLRAVAAAPNRPLLVVDQGGVWSFSGGQLDTWRLVAGGMSDAVPFYPG